MEAESQAFQQAVQVYRIPPPEATIESASNEGTKRRSRLNILYLWIFFAVTILILLVLSYSLPKFGVQHISSSCGAINPVSNAPMSHMYYNLWKGFGSSPECSNDSQDFCIRWTDKVWKQFLSSTPSHDYSVSYSWRVAQVSHHNVLKTPIEHTKSEMLHYIYWSFSNNTK